MTLVVPAREIPLAPHIVNKKPIPAGWLMVRLYEYVPLGILGNQTCKTVNRYNHTPPLQH